MLVFTLPTLVLYISTQTLLRKSTCCVFHRRGRTGGVTLVLSDLPARPDPPSTDQLLTGQAEKSSVTHQNTETGSVRVHNADPPPVRSQTADPAAVGPLGTETGSEPHSVEAEDKDKLAEPDLPSGSGGFSPLCSADRGKSKSTPTLASLHRQPKGSPGKPSKVAKASKAEQDRQQILEEMKKRTQLLTDNSWIRQRRASTLKEPLSTGAPLRR
ncbi:LIM domain only protein 7 [Merluccius polli]|uniref:LIM domain only protein 7 n=1 Tax=Merluccius polli TaxID=89951 RepID=A0AA47NVT3_MERPO|nr:LIM domain only protein 7 [Merluccius polli]